MEFRRSVTELFDSADIKLRNYVKLRGIPLNTEFRKIRIPPELFFDGIMDTLTEICTALYNICSTFEKIQPCTILPVQQR